MLRRLRERALVDLVAASDLEKKADFEDKKPLEKLLKAIEKAKVKMEAKLSFDEEHSLFEIVLSDGSGHSARVNWTLISMPDVKRLRTLGRAISAADKPPFTVARNGDKVTKENAARSEERRVG